MNKIRTNKLFTGIMSTACAAAIVITGTLALSGSASTKANRFTSGASAIVPPVIEDQFPGNHDANGVYSKNIFVDNTKGTDPVYVRVKLQDFLIKNSATAPVGNESTWSWTDHRPQSDSAVCDVVTDTTNHHDWFKWNMGKNVHVGLDPNAQAGYWIYDAVDGYTYWSKMLQPGEKTDMLLTSVQATKLDKQDYFYAIRGLLEYVGNGDGSNDPAKNWVTNTDTQIKTTGIRDYFKNLFENEAPPTTVTYSNPRVTLNNKTPGATTSTSAGVVVSYDGSDGKTYSGSIKSAAPAAFSADTTSVVYTLADPSGKEATITVKLSDVGVTVSPNPAPVSSVTISGPANVDVTGDPITLTATVVPADTGATVTWRSSNPNILTVDGNGTVTGINAGTANVTATAGGVVSVPHVISVTNGTQDMIFKNGRFYNPVKTYNNLYQDMGANGQTPGDFKYAANGNVDDLRPVIYYPTDWVLKAASKYDVPQPISADYYVNVMGASVPLYPSAPGVSGLEYNEAFSVDNNGKVGTNGCTGVAVADGVKIK